jgi:hypothetical protein
MKTDSIIKGFNNFLESKRKELGINKKGTIILQKSILPKEFKILKECIYTLWFVHGKNKNKFLTLSKIDRVPTELEEKMYEEMDVLLCNTLFSYINDNNIKDLITCEYGNN